MVRRDAMVNETEPLVLAADIGGIHMRAALVERNGEILVHRTAATDCARRRTGGSCRLDSQRHRNERAEGWSSRGRWASRRRRLRHGDASLGAPPPRELDDGPHERRADEPPRATCLHRQRCGSRCGGRGFIRCRPGHSRRRLSHDLHWGSAPPSSVVDGCCEAADRSPRWATP